MSDFALAVDIAESRLPLPRPGDPGNRTDGFEEVTRSDLDNVVC